MSDLIDSLHDGTLRFPLLVSGDPEPAGELDVVSPWDGSKLATVATGNVNHANAAMDTAWRLYRNRDAWLPIHERVAILERLAELMSAEVDELTILAASEGGKPLVDSRVEVIRAIDGVRLCVEALRGDPGNVIPIGTTPATAGRIAFTRKEPIGVVVAVSAFNHPLNLIVHQVGPAVAAGCPVIVKPAGDTPLSCLNFVRLLRAAGLPEDWCQAIVADDREAAERLVTHPRVGFFSFIGSARVGWMLRSKLAPGARCALEHGGVAPVIVAADADLDDAVPLLAKAGFYHAGQVCVSVQRVFAHRSIARALADRIAEAGNGMSVGDPTLADTDVGPLIRHAETDRVHEWVSDALERGAELISGGEKLSPSTYRPTVLFNPPDDAIISRNEIFGPVVQVYEYDDIDEAIARANALDVSFQASVFSTNINTCLYAFKHLNGSAIMVNDHTAFRVDWMPFAGLNVSGHGVGGIPHTFRDMQVEKMMVMRSPLI